ncbi:MAG TPA: hypothetical protein VGY48_16415 [Vicinamibacterales bacterium]|jgi:hypothetical protein|nr:hypothetical protein [Vicinamibacterales bacterium]
MSTAKAARLAYLYLLRVPLLVGIAFVVLPVIALKTRASALLLGLFDVGGSDVWTVATTAFVLSLTLMTTCFLVTAYADRRCDAPFLHVRYPIAKGWYILAALLAIPTLIAVYVTGQNSAGEFAMWTLAGLLAAVVIYETARFLVPRVDKFAVARGIAAWLSRHPELGSGYVDSAQGTFLPGHRLAAALMLLSALVYVVIGRQMGDPNGLAIPTLTYALLLGVITCWLLAGVAFFLDRYRLPLSVPIALLVLVTGARNGSDHYFRLHPGWGTPAVSPLAALRGHPPGTPQPRSAIVVAANGGGIQAAAWTARVLTGLEEVCRDRFKDRCHFAESVRFISSVSGGSVGAMFVTAAYRYGSLPDKPALEDLVARAERSSLEHVGWGLLYRDVFRPFYPHFDYEDRGSALEEAWQRDRDLSAPVESWRADVAAGARPANVFNATISDSGERLLIGTANPPRADGRRNFEDVFPGEDIDIVTAARLSAAFTYVSPAARADTDDPASVHFVDGGYYDLYGVSSLIDWLDEALRADQAEEAPSIDRILIVQLRGAPPDTEVKEKKRGWFYQVYAPLSALLGTRDTGQLAHNAEEVALLERAWHGRVSVSSVVFQFCGGSPPLSWHLTEPEKQDIGTQWEMEQQSASTSAVLDFLSASEKGDRNDVPARCSPKPVQAQ